MAKRDYYEVLGIDKNADESTIKKAYRKKAMEFHPDKNADNPEAEDKFKEASEAYEVLSDKDKKARYDQYGHAGLEGTFGQGGFNWSDFTHQGDFSDIFGGFSSIFDQFFGGGFSRASGRTGKPAGEDITVEVSLTLAEVATGVEKTLKLSVKDACEACHGTGSADGNRKSCPQCKGRGYIQQTQRSIFGTMATNVACPTCRGEGAIIENRCPTCRGDGRVQSAKTVTVKIPAGVSEGQYLRLRGQGHAGMRGGPHGDVIVRIHEKNDDVFEREGKDLVCAFPISFTQAALGSEITVPTLTAKIKMKVPAGTQSHHVFRLRGQGLPDLDGGSPGDLYVRVIVITPTKLNAKEKQLFEDLGKFDANLHLKPGKGFFDKLKDFFV